MEDVRRCDNLDEVADSHHIVVLSQQPDNLDVKAAREKFAEAFSEGQRRKIEARLAAASKTNLASFIEGFATFTPSLFVIIRYDTFNSSMTNLHGFFTPLRMIALRSQS